MRSQPFRPEFGVDVEIDWQPIWPAEDGRLEPIFFDAPVWVEFDEPERLDPQRAEPLGTGEADAFDPLDPAAAELEPGLTLPPSRASPIAYGGSLGMHAAILLLLLSWHAAPAEAPAGVPVQLLIETQPPPPDLAAAPLAEIHTPTATAPPPPSRPKRVSVPPPPPKPSPRPPPPAVAAAKPVIAEPAKPAPASQPAQPVAVAAARPSPGPSAEQAGTDYFSYLVLLTRPHLDLLPLSFLAGRHGRTVLTVVVAADGTISRVAIKTGSGYPDIDARIVQIVTAVGRFPPPPERLRNPTAELDFNLAFPDALQR